ncbi:hypothetical protein Q7A53_18160 [Halobacillus rhizosphaerae]
MEWKKPLTKLAAFFHLCIYLAVPFRFFPQHVRRAGFFWLPLFADLPG